MMDGLYNLGLDFERKRQFNKAALVFVYMAEHHPKYKDLEQRISRSKAMAETVILGGGSCGRTNSSAMILNDSTIENPMLGSYQVEKALGKGAMGVVHRGSKPANIMYEADTRVVKVTDFGIVHITDSSKTKTGMLLGAASYMSPEQLAGKLI